MFNVRNRLTNAKNTYIRNSALCSKFGVSGQADTLVVPIFRIQLQGSLQFILTTMHIGSEVRTPAGCIANQKHNRGDGSAAGHCGVFDLRVSKPQDDHINSGRQA